MKTIRLALSGGALVLGPLLAATLRDHKAEIAAAQRNELAPPDMLELTCVLATACAQRVAPATTLAEVEQLVDMENFGQVFAACWGVTVPEPVPGEALQAVSPST